IRESFPIGEGGLDLHPCISCRHYPLYGLMVVTDRARPAGIRKADQLTLESLSYAVSAVLQNASLYHELEMGERFRDQILDGMSNGLITTDDRGRVIFINRRAQELLTSSEKQLVGRKLDSLMWVPGVESPSKAALLGREPSLRWEGRMGLSPESSIPVLVTLAKYRREEGGLVGVIAVIEDLSAVHLMQEEIRHLDTLAAIGRFASSMAHEIRNPLGGISAGMDYLARKGAFEDEDAESVTVIQEEIQRLDGIIRNLFQVARPARLQKEETSALQTAQRVHRSIKDWAQECGVEIRIESEDLLPSYRIDRDQIHQVLFNLLKNAVEVSEPGTTVLLKLSKMEHASTKPELEEAIAFEVIDQGPGIAREDLPHIFEPFYSKKADGTGLGLFVSHNIVERHGGVLQAFSEPARGARIRILLPLAPTTIGSQS
ncbi:MAG TPA: ATP-binding protein, partial [Candidatus Krumholzibacteria bacterium]|nr:ATP-binding protein [Candidatus Krumholzibacteria bacterium]